jgi:hypothetical protein
MMISVEDAEALGQALIEGAKNARAQGQTEFDLTANLSDQSKQSLDSLQAAIDAAP